ncbi:MAG: hypothetical protein MPJ50_01810 [Pirellulales bacterium]|nr:hypothetical protein [Pirellulales bacterium]
MAFCTASGEKNHRANAAIPASGNRILLAIQQDTSRSGQGTKASAQQAIQLVEQLSSQRFQERDQATRKLAAMGMTAVAALQAGLESSDAEVRSRCQAILADVIGRDFEDRVKRFQADPDGTDGYGLPGFDAYTQLLGNTPATRTLFANMLEQSRGVMMALSRDPEELAVAIDTQIVNVSHIMESPAAMAALFFASSRPNVRCETPTLDMLNFLSTSRVFTEMATTGPGAEACQSILNEWITANGDLVRPADCVYMALRYGLPAGLPLAQSLAADPGADANDRMHAVLAVAKLGDASHSGLLVKLFDEQDVCLTYANTNWEAQLRDIALACVLHLKGEDPKDFGFVNRERSDATLYTPVTLSFAGERERQLAFAKYHARFGRRPDRN